MKTNSKFEQPTGQHRKWQFSLRHAMIAIAIFAVGISFWTAWNQADENAGLKFTIRDLKSRLGELDVTDREHLLHITPKWSTGPLSWNWKVYAPQGRHFVLNAATRVDSATPVRETVSVEIPSGQSDISVSLHNDAKGKWTCWIHSQAGQSKLPFADTVPEPKFGSHSSSSGFAFGYEVHAEGKDPIRLLKFEVGTPHPESAGDSLLIWISEAKGEK